MSTRTILTWPDARLNLVCEPVSEITDDIQVLAADMLETMYDAPGRGLAAPQVGAMLRIFVMDATWKEGTADPMVCINPKITLHSETISTGPEGCLSIPGVEAEVSRPESVHMVWTDLSGTMREADLTGFSALCAQHELDHLDGIVTLDRVDATQRADILATYKGQS